MDAVRVAALSSLAYRDHTPSRDHTCVLQVWAEVGEAERQGGSDHVTADLRMSFTQLNVALQVDTSLNTLMGLYHTNEFRTPRIGLSLHQ